MAHLNLRKVESRHGHDTHSLDPDGDVIKGTRCFHATIHAVRSGVCAVIDDLAGDGLASPHLETVEIVLAEVINNIVEHAYGPDQESQADEPCMVRVSYDLYPNTLMLTVVDRGKPFPDAELPPGRTLAPDIDREELPEGGFGWRIIRDLTIEQTYQRDSEENFLQLRFDFS